jgi:hypothetical protein
MVIREWACSIVFATLIAIIIQTRRRTATAKWVWAAGALWFVFGLSGGLGLPVDNPWLTFSGIACSESPGIPCMQFWIFTVPVVRSVAYSIASALARVRVKE